MCHSSCGGSTRIATDMSVELARRGYRVHVFARTTPFGLSGDATAGLVLHQSEPDLRADPHPATLYVDWSADERETLLSCILRVIAEEGLDILHFHYAVPFAAIAEEIRRRLGPAAPRYIGTLHGTDVSIRGRDPLEGPRLGRALRGPDALTTVSRSHAELAAEVFELATPPEVIPNFVDLSRFRPRSRTSIEHGASAGGGPGVGSPARIVHISNFRPVKNPESVVRIFQGIRGKIDAELWLIGDGPEMDKIRSMFNQEDTGSAVRFWGLCRDVGPILAQADLLLMTSLSESFCLAALEAMACGLPVLATNVGGLPELVIHGETGLLFPVGDHAAAVEMGTGLLSDPARHRSMGAAAAVRAREFGPGEVVPAYEELYRRVLDDRGRGAALRPASVSSRE